MVGENSLRYDNRPIAVIDFETESINLATARPWQASWIIIENGKVTEEHDYFPWWSDLKISEGAARVTRFNFADYQAKSTNSWEVLEKLESYLYSDKYLIIGQNVLGFDTMIHQVFRRALGKKPDYSFLPRTIDTLALGRAYKYGIKKPQDKNLLAWQYSMLSKHGRGVKCGLSALAKEFDIPVDENKTHDGLYDVKLNYLVYKALIKALDI